ncbi:MAG TPA: hypothetical protein VH877_15195 [Polyangia bacterium]|jgi:hypothetical protein|nr:hypothetical protein [Polyangia bacterium]
MPSKLVIDRQKSARSVLALNGPQVQTIVARLTDLLTPYLRGGERLPDIDLLVQLVLRLLDDACDRMLAADQANDQERADDHVPRQERDRTTKALYHELTGARDLLSSVFGRTAARALGFAGITPRDPVALARFAGRIVHTLQEQELPPPKHPSITWDPRQTVDRLAELRDHLDRLLTDLAVEQSQADSTQGRKQRSIAAYDDRFRRVVTFLQALFRLAGADDLADHVRPSRRRPGRLAPPKPKPDPAAPRPRKRTPGSSPGA